MIGIRGPVVGRTAPRPGHRARRRPAGARGLHEPIEDGHRVERTRRSLGVVLDRLDRALAVAQAFDRTVVEVDLADPEARCGRQRLADHLDLVVLGGHLDVAGVDVADRVVGAMVAEAEAVGLGARRTTHELVPEADPEQRSSVVDDGPGQRHLLGETGGIAWAG